MLLCTPQEHWSGEVRINNNVNAEIEPMLLNKNKRSFRVPGFLGGSLQAKSRGVEKSLGVGDCLLLDLTKGFFAVADASDRNPKASREFMIMFSRMLSEIENLSADYIYDENEVASVQEQIKMKAESLIKSLSFRDGCTFTGVLILKTGKGFTGLMLHTGDSFLISCDLRLGNAVQLTKDNFWMVGRSRHFFQIELLPIDSDTKMLLATDGFGNVPLPEGVSREKYVLELFRSFDVDEIPDRFFDRIGNSDGIWDDTAIIAVDPMAIDRFSGCYILGGTSTEEENVFREEKKLGRHKDRYLPCSWPVNDSAGNILFL